MVELRQLGPAGALGIAWMLLPAVLGGLLLLHLGAVGDWLERDRALGLLVYVLAFAATAGLGLLPTYAQAVLGGWVFGFLPGTAAALVGFSLAALVGYGIARFVSGERVRALLRRHPKGEAVRRALLEGGRRRTTWVIALTRLPPNSPFALSNLAFASAGVAIVPFFLGTLLGMAPRTALTAGLAHLGAQSGARDLGEFVAKGPGWPVLVGGVLLLLLVLHVLSSLARSALAKAGAAGDGEVAAP